MLKTQHPNPQFMRADWQCLNGEWSFGFKHVNGFRFSNNDSLAKEIRNKGEYSHIINVPFCLESSLSGIGYTDFVNLAWYRRSVNVDKSAGRVFLIIGAADNLTTVLINGECAGRHKGGYTPIRLDITDLAVNGENEIFVLCEDDVKNPMVIRGKQSERKKSHGCDYTRTTGIWQSVYLEYTPESYIEGFKLYPDAENNRLSVSLEARGKADLKIEAFYDSVCVGIAEAVNVSSSAVLQINLSQSHLWEVGNGRLYDLKITFGEDTVYSYFGLRNVCLDGYKFLINGKSVFQRLVLDQGFYKEGIYTAKDDNQLKRDIELSMDLGFNGARLHQKAFEPRFLYFCDKMGYLVWGEYANWGLDYSSPKSVDVFLNEWGEVLKRDFNHPSIIGWCPFNETWDYKGRRQYDPLLSTVYDFTKAFDITRPCIDTSGNFHVKTDIYDVHDYSYDVEFFKNNYDRLMTEGYLYEHVLLDNKGRQHYGGQPTFVSEYGGIKWESDTEHKAWGYGVDVKTEQELADRYCGLTDALIKNHCMFGFCYTQLYDIEQEQNGLYTYERKRKFSDSVYEQIKAVNSQIAAIEK